MSIHISHTKKRIVAADEDQFDFGDNAGGDEEFYSEDVDDTFDDKLDDIADTVDDMQEDIEDIQEEDDNIEADNNIEDHYIAECEKCHGIFISAMIESDQEVEKITGICPLCGKESDQYLRWVVKPIE